MDSNTQQDFIYTNVISLKDMSKGSPPKKRIEVPQDFEVFGYSGQKLNIWDFQKDQLRKHIQKETGKLYTYSEKYLGGAFPVVEMQELSF